MRFRNSPQGYLLDMNPEVRDLVSRHLGALAAVEKGTPLLAALQGVGTNPDPLAVWEADEVADEVAREASDRIVEAATVAAEAVADAGRPLDDAQLWAVSVASNYLYANGLTRPEAVGQGQAPPVAPDGAEMLLPTTQPVRLLFATLAAMAAAKSVRA